MFFYYLEVIGTVLMFMFLGLFFSPFFGGCLGIFLILFILGAIIVFFSINFIWFLLVGLIFYMFGWILKYYKWYKFPTLDAYLGGSPHCRLSNGILCKHCNSANIKHIGLFNQSSRWRYYLCESCGQMLYRFTVL